MADDENKHNYPEAFMPGAHWAFDEAWEILDKIRPGVIPQDVRYWLAGAIAGKLSRQRVIDRPIIGLRHLVPSSNLSDPTVKEFVDKIRQQVDPDLIADDSKPTE